MIKEYLSRMIALCLVCLFVAASPALAVTVLLTPGATDTCGSIEIALPIDRIGSVPLPRGQILIHGDIAQVSMIPEWEFDRHIVLEGPVLDTTIARNPDSAVISGVMLFNNGEWINNFDSPNAVETVITSANAVEGRISEVTATDIAMRTTSGDTVRVPLGQITDIKSTRVFKFTMPTTAFHTAAAADQPMYADTRRVLINPTLAAHNLRTLRAQVAKQSTDGDWSTARLVALGTVLSMMELAQVVPVIVLPSAAGELRTRSMIRQITSLNANAH